MTQKERQERSREEIYQAALEEFGTSGYDNVNMERICGGDPEGKLHLLLEYTARPGEVADPWYTGDFQATWEDVEAGCTGLLQSLLDSGALKKSRPV